MSKQPYILVVEDNAANQMLTTALLGRDGFDTEVADSAEDALVSLKARRPDLILMDVQLPGMDGLTFAQSLKSVPEAAGVPIVALTSHAMRGDRERAMAAGCASYLSKPIDTRTLSEELRAVLNQSRPDSVSA
ncbi:MAG TPA: response regulator [Candidatus Dormibacteraeota bacterium]|nr:response regulator [Candidatus Dormibacteraeota bacterium]